VGFVIQDGGSASVAKTSASTQNLLRPLELLAEVLEAQGTPASIEEAGALRTKIDEASVLDCVTVM